jgi:hypothetical protein
MVQQQDLLLSPLSREEFGKVQNSFYMHFAGAPGKKHLIADIYRKQPFYQACWRGNSEFRKLARKLRKLLDTEGEQIIYDEKFQKPLYEAYKMMRQYADDERLMFV